MNTVIIVENNREERHNLKTHLQKNKFIVFEASVGKRLYEVIENHHVDIILLNYKLPDGTALDFVKTIRDFTNAPLLITGGHAEIAQRIASLNLGADDFILKPYDINELTARIQASLRRYEPSESEQKPDIDIVALSPEVRFENWILDRNRMQAYAQDGHNCNLTPAEFKLLDLLIRSNGEVLHRDNIRKELQQFTGKKITQKSLNVKMVRLRKKLNDCARNPKIIKTIRDIGYLFDCPVFAHKN